MSFFVQKINFRKKSQKYTQIPYFPGELPEPKGEEHGGLELGVHGPGVAQAWQGVFPTSDTSKTYLLS
jgi:hypothetical protein